METSKCTTNKYGFGTTDDQVIAWVVLLILLFCNDKDVWLAVFFTAMFLYPLKKFYDVKDTQASNPAKGSPLN